MTRYGRINVDLAIDPYALVLKEHPENVGAVFSLEHYYERVVNKKLVKVDSNGDIAIDSGKAVAEVDMAVEPGDYAIYVRGGGDIIWTQEYNEVFGKKIWVMNEPIEKIIDLPLK
jgi:hypothetical protein